AARWSDSRGWASASRGWASRGRASRGWAALPRLRRGPRRERVRVAMHPEPRIGGSAMESLTGRLLVATPSLKDPNFERTVVLLVAHEEGGALGVVLNRATEVPVADVLEGWAPLAGEPAVVFEGGPVQP